MVPGVRRPIVPPSQMPKVVDEVWEYSLANVQACRKHPRAPPLRHVPPGYLSAPEASDAPPPSERLADRTRAIFLGDLGLEERARCVGELRPLVWPINDVWDEAAMARLALSARMVVNVHKRCLQPEELQPVEATRLSQILSMGGAVVSQRSHPHDEAAYSGLVTFVGLRHMPRVVSETLRATAPPPSNLSSSEQERAHRLAAFRTLFAPDRILARALAHAPFFPF